MDLLADVNLDPKFDTLTNTYWSYNKSANKINTNAVILSNCSRPKWSECNTTQKKQNHERRLKEMDLYFWKMSFLMPFLSSNLRVLSSEFWSTIVSEWCKLHKRTMLFNVRTNCQVKWKQFICISRKQFVACTCHVTDDHKNRQKILLSMETNWNLITNMRFMGNTHQKNTLTFWTKRIRRVLISSKSR